MPAVSGCCASRWDGTGRDTTETEPMTRVGRAKECGMPLNHWMRAKKVGTIGGGRRKQRQQHGPSTADHRPSQPINELTSFNLQQSGFLGSALCFWGFGVCRGRRLRLFAPLLNGVRRSKRRVAQWVVGVGRGMEGRGWFAQSERGKHNNKNGQNGGEKLKGRQRKRKRE